MEKEKVRDAINAFYQGAGVDKKITGEINEHVAYVFGEMLQETKKCSTAFAWVPVPSGGKATIVWIVRNIARSMIERLRNRSSVTCARGVIAIWDRELQMAGLGL